MLDWRLPRIRFLALRVWKRNALVWTRLLGSALMMNFGEPVLILLGLGYGLGMFIGEMDGMSYLTFLASGIVASSAMNTASFESMYSAFTRMEQQQTYSSMLATPLEVDDILAGEMLWCATKGLVSGIAILIVAGLLGGVKLEGALAVLPVVFLIGLCFAGPGLVITAFSPTYDFFNYYQTIVLMPTFLLSGVFYPTDTLPLGIQWLVQVLPLSHAVAVVRPLVSGVPPTDVVLHLAVLAAYAVIGYYLAVVFIRRRLLI